MGPSWRWTVGVLVALIALAAFGSRVVVIRLGEPSGGEPGGEVAPRTGEGAPPLRVALPVSQSLWVGLERYRPLLSYLEGRTARRLSVRSPASVEGLCRMLRSREIELVIIEGHTFASIAVETHLRSLGIAQAAGEVTHRGALVCRRDAPFRTAQDLAGTAFAMIGPRDPFTGVWIASITDPVPPDRFFGRIVRVAHESAALYAVLTGRAQATAVDEKTFRAFGLRPEGRGALRALARSPPFPNLVLGAASHVTPADVEGIRRAIREAPSTRDGQLALAAARVDGFVEAPEGEIRRMAR